MKLPILGKITSKYGNRVHPITGVTSFHNGIDISAPEGTEIPSISDGVVNSIYENTTGGKQLIIKHDTGFTTGYAHLKKNDFFKIGERVLQGQIVALVGNTGKSTGAHLHYTLRKNGVLVNPLSYV
ncbi:M23 family metallopeptidase [Flavobacterium sp.]|uniref:M23 family metallopeptidase n=1 Tax=Flavobacterium sp. TaxID=239 RepID=UPI0025C0318E|nr:M23 family metallopeptidase [Flavobacterium sp.]